MSPPTDGVAIYTIRTEVTGNFATLVDSTPRQYITVNSGGPKGQEQRIWQVTYNAETGIVTMKNPVTGNYATINDMTGYVVGDESAQEFKLVLMRHDESVDWVAIQEKDSDRLWTVDDPHMVEGSKIQVRAIPSPKTNHACWWKFTLEPGVASEGEETSLL